MRYHYKESDVREGLYGELYICNHPVYSRCTLYREGEKGLAVIQQRFDPVSKRTWWSEVDAKLASDLYLQPRFPEWFRERCDVCVNGLWPTVTVRQAMWALRMKPLPKQRWETVFDRKDI